MTGIALAPDAVTALPGAAAAAVAWRSRGTLHVTTVVKATFAFAPGAAMPRTEPQGILRAEVHHGNNPGRSVRFTSDLAPALGRVDVLFTGYAHAPPGGKASALPVRLAIFDGHRQVLEKRLLVQDKAGFQHMPLVYERAVTGAAGQENPLGLTATPGEPNILDPARPDRPAGFGPIARAWPVRKRLLGSLPRKALEGPIAEIPEGFDWSYFQAAPPDQRIDVLRGDEWIILDGLHPTLARVQTRLPGARGVARIHGLAAFGVSEGQLIELRADTLRIDGEEQLCTVVWRQSFPLASEAALAAVRLVAGVATGGEALAWPDLRAAAIEDPSTESLESWVRVQPEGTLALSDAEIEVVAEEPGSHTIALDGNAAANADRRATLPFVRQDASALARSSAALRKQAPSTGTLRLGQDEGSATNDRRALPFRTFALAPEQEAEVKGRPALPFTKGPQAAPLISRPAREPGQGLFTGTLDLPPDEDARPRGAGALPFLGASKVDPDQAPTEKLYVKPRHRAIAHHDGPASGPPSEPLPQVLPLQVIAVGPTAAGAVVWRTGGERLITVFVKATFELRHAEDARLIDALPILSDDRRDDASGVVQASETAPYLPSAGVTLSGHAHAPQGEPMPIMEVRLAISRGQPLLDKTLHVYGDRGTTPSVPQPFERMPLIYERAYGGVGLAENPVGTGAGPRGGVLPNLLDPADPYRPAGFGPIPKRWPSRKRLLGKADAFMIEAPSAEIPEGFDWQYFQAAPVDQQIDFLNGEEWILLEGVHPTIPRFETRLPHAKARAIRRVTAPGGAIREEPVELFADTLSIDADRGVCSVIWRGHWAVGETDSLSSMSVIAGVETSDYQPAWPQVEPAPQPALEPAPQPAAASPTPETGLRADVLARLRAREPLHGLELAGADLRGIDFSGATLARLDLRGARLDRCTFTEARLTEAKLTEADLTSATLRAADLSGADLSRAVLTEACFDRATLTDANLSSARGAGASFEGASGRRVSFARGSWDGAVFAAVELMSSDFTGASLSGASFRGASLIDARFDDARGRGAVFDGASMPRVRAAGATLTGSSFRDVDAEGSIWERATLDESSFQGAKLKEANLSRAVCHRASFAAADAAGVNLQYLHADGANLSGANLEGAELRNARLHEATFDGANLRKAAAHKADLSGSRFVGADLSQAVLRNAKLKGALLMHARLDATSFVDADLEQANVHGASMQTAKLNGAKVKGLIETDPEQ